MGGGEGDGQLAGEAKGNERGWVGEARQRGSEWEESEGASRRLRRDGQPHRGMPVSQAEGCAAKEDVARMLSVDERNGERDRRTAHAKARVSEQESLTRARGERTQASRRCLGRTLAEVRHARTSRASRVALHLMRYDAFCAADTSSLCVSDPSAQPAPPSATQLRRRFAAALHRGSIPAASGAHAPHRIMHRFFGFFGVPAAMPSRCSRMLCAFVSALTRTSVAGNAALTGARQCSTPAPR